MPKTYSALYWSVKQTNDCPVFHHAFYIDISAELVVMMVMLPIVAVDVFYSTPYETPNGSREAYKEFSKNY